MIDDHNDPTGRETLIRLIAVMIINGQVWDEEAKHFYYENETETLAGIQVTLEQWGYNLTPEKPENVATPKEGE